FLVALELDVPAPDRLSHRLHCLTTDGRSEVHVDATILVDRLARSKRIAEKRELDRRECLLPVDVLAVDDPCLVRVHFETALAQPLPYPAQHQPSLSFAL